MTAVKRCSTCQADKPHTEFGVRRREPDGLNAQCKPCKREAGRASYRRNRTKRIAAQKERYWADPEASREYHRQYGADHRDKVRERAWQWRIDNPERARETQARIRAENPERSAQWRAEHPDYHRDWKARNRDRVLSYSANRRARKRDQWDEDVDRETLFQRDAGVCGICHHPADPADWDVDHIIPLTRGGRHSYANTRVSHPPCNNWKGTRLDRELPRIPDHILQRALAA